MKLEAGNEVQYRRDLAVEETDEAQNRIELQPR